jgi:hypothetical protein
MSDHKDLLKKIELFEKVAMYGDRGSFLKSLAQGIASDHEFGSLRPSNDEAIIEAAKATHEGIGDWIASAGESQKDIPQGIKGLPASLAGASDAIRAFVNRPPVSLDIDTLKSLYGTARKLAAIDTIKDMSPQGKQAWSSLVLPHATNLVDLIQKQVQYLAWYKKNYSPKEESATNTTNAPNTPATPTKGTLGDPATVETLQIFLNNAFRSDIIAGKKSPIRQDGKFGEETQNALTEWAQRNNVSAADAQSLADIALQTNNRAV